MTKETLTEFNELGHALSSTEMRFGVSADAVAAMLEDSGYAPQLVFPPDTRRWIMDTDQYPWNTIGELWMSFPNGQDYTGTATLIDRQHVLTAAHNVYGNQMGGWARKVYFTPARNGDNNPYETVGASRIFITEDYFTLSPPNPDRTPEGGVVDYTLYTQDYAVVRLKEPLDLPIMGILAASHTQLNGTIARISGYPGDKPSGTMWTDEGPLAEPDEHFLFYKINTWKGESGAGLVVNLEQPDGKCIVGVHVAGDRRLDSNFAVRLTNEEVSNIRAWMRSS